mgnify:CR=1 FL=1
MNSRLIDLETKLAFAEHLLDQLNEVVTEQNRRISALVEKVNRLERQATSQGSAADASFQKPPHY